MLTSPDKINFNFHLFYYFFQITLCLLLTCKPIPSDAQAKSDCMDTFLNSKPFISWAKVHAFPLQNSDSATGSSDLRPLKKMIGNACVVALGEPAHGFHEPLAFRNRMFRFLVENCGFTTIVLEASLPESRFAADFVAGRSGTAEAAAAKLTIGKPAPENIELLEWMRKYNANPAHSHKVKFYGMDIQLKGYPGDTTPSHHGLDEALAYLSEVDPKEKMKAASALAPYMNRLSVAKYPLLSLDEHNRLSASLDDLIALFERERIKFIAVTSRERYEWAYRNAIVARQTDRMVRISPLEQPGKIPPEAWMAVNTRDAAMADNLIWILNNEVTGGKVLVFAHNAHVKNAETVGGVWNAFAQPPNSTGQYLRSILGNDLFIIGSSCAPSAATAQPCSLDSALLEVNKPRFLLDLRTAASNSQIASWLGIRRPMEANMVTYLMLSTSTAFDALLFINKNAILK